MSQEWSGMRVAVTGGSGFIGGAVIRALRARGDEVVALARSDEAAQKVAGLGASAIRGGLVNVAALRKACRGSDLVIHCAAKLTGAPRDADVFRKVNVDGTRNVVESAKAVGVPRLVHISTEQVLLGPRPIVDADEDAPYPRRVFGLYAQTKQAAERLVREASDDKLETVCVRPRFVWGVGDTNVLPSLVTAARAGRFAWIGGGRHLTSTCHVDNAVEGILAAAAKGRPGAVYFITDGKPVVFRDFVSELLRTQGIEPEGRVVPRSLAMTAAVAAEMAWRLLPFSGPPPMDRAVVRVVGETCTVIDRRARKELGYRGRVTPEVGLAALRAGRTKAKRVPVRA